MAEGNDCDVTVVIVNYNTRHLLAECLESLWRSSDGVRLQVVLIDNASRDGSPDFILERFAGRCDVVFNDANVGFGRANNQAVPLARGRHLLLLNTDAFVHRGSLAAAVAHLDDHPGVGILGARLESRDGSLQPSCRYFPTPWNEFLLGTGLGRFFPRSRAVDDLKWDHRSLRACDWVPGCFYLVRREVVEQVGLFDPRFFLYYEEVDHCFAAKRAGWAVEYFPETTVVHLGGESAATDGPLEGASRQVSRLAIESAMLFHRKRYGRLGLLALAGLTLLSDALRSTRAVVRGRGAPGAGWKRSSVLFGLLGPTSFGLRPTR